ncbi:hypothetical protein [Natronococcus sp.]|uniref:hypothetical protein n=1 Tax=Natronococcus sp. TaxID=35747 RepID=UPI0025CE972D|nr:hypothetical protein [Natronococcus sp.]
MERRKFLIGAGGTAIAASALVGSGAFTSVEADRDITIDVEDDSDAFLALSAADTSNGDEYVEEEDGIISISITDTDAGGEGVNRDATTTFDSLLNVENQGTQEVYFGYENGDLTNAGVALYQSDADNGGGLNFDTTPDQIPRLEAGESIEVGLFIFDTDAWEDEVGEGGGTVSVTLVASEEDPT